MLCRRVGQWRIPPSAHLLLHRLPVDGKLIPRTTLRLAVGVARVDECAVAGFLVRVGAGHNRLEVGDVLVHFSHLRGSAFLWVAGAGSPARGR